MGRKPPFTSIDRADVGLGGHRAGLPKVSEGWLPVVLRSRSLGLTQPVSLISASRSRAAGRALCVRWHGVLRTPKGNVAIS